MTVPPPDIHGAIDAVWRIESAKVIAGLTRIVRDVGLAEDLAQEALLVALEEVADPGVVGRMVANLADVDGEAPRHRSVAAA